MGTNAIIRSHSSDVASCCLLKYLLKDFWKGEVTEQSAPSCSQSQLAHPDSIHTSAKETPSIPKTIPVLTVSLVLPSLGQVGGVPDTHLVLFLYPPLQVLVATVDNANLLLQIDNARLTADDFRTK